MIFEGNKSVIEAIKEKKRLMDAGEDSSHIRPALLLGAGLMKGVYAAGAMVAFDELGYTKVFTSAAGISSGAPTLAYFLSGQANLLPSLIAEDIASTKLIRPWHIWNTVNLKYFVSLFEGKTGRGIDFDTLFQSPTKFSIVVSEYKTARPVFLTPTTKAFFMDCMRATVAIAGTVNKKIIIDDVRYVDGASTQPYALDVAYDNSDATHVLAIMNQDSDATHSPRSEKIMSATFWRHRFTKPLLAASNARHAARGEFAYHALAGDIPAGIVWGDDRVGSFELQSEVLYSATEASRVWWRELLSE